MSLQRGILFTQLVDAPTTYLNQGGKVVVVSETEDGVEFSRNLILGAPLIKITEATLLGETHYVVLCDGTFQVTLPDATESDKRVFFIKNIGNGVITIADEEGALIDGEASKLLSTQYEGLMFVSDGVVWWII